jgi:hypothetical protein
MVGFVSGTGWLTLLEARRIEAPGRIWPPLVVYQDLAIIIRW